MYIYIYIPFLVCSSPDTYSIVRETRQNQAFTAGLTRNYIPCQLRATSPLPQRPWPSLMQFALRLQEGSKVVDRLKRVGMVRPQLRFLQGEGFALQLVRLASRDPTGGMGIWGIPSLVSCKWFMEGIKWTRSTSRRSWKNASASQILSVFHGGMQNTISISIAHIWWVANFNWEIIRNSFVDGGLEDVPVFIWHVPI